MKDGTYGTSDLEAIENGRRKYGTALDILRGRGAVWHRTSVESLRGILDKKAIFPNVGQFEATYPQSQNCYGRTIQAVCLFDFDSVEVEEALRFSWKWGPFLVDRGIATVWIAIPAKSLDKALYESALAFKGGNLPTVFATGAEGLAPGEKYVPTFFPSVEAWHRGPIPTSAFSGYVVFGEPGEQIEHREVPTGPQALDQIGKILGEWERHRTQVITNPCRTSLPTYNETEKGQH